MKALLDGLKTYFDSSALAGQVHGLWAYRAPQNTLLPFVTYLIPQSIPAFTRDSGENLVTIAFSVWTEEESPSAAIILGDILRKAFDFATFPCGTSGYVVSMVRQADRLIEDDDGGWQHISEYLITYNKAR